jgi:hypothetical protein
MRGGVENRPYNKIVGPFSPCGFGLRQVVHGLTDPPQGIERAGRSDRQAAVAELDARRWNGERNVETVVDKQERWKVGKLDCKAIELEPGEFTAPSVKGQIGTAAIGQRPRDRIDVRPTGRAFIRDRVQPR